MSEPSADRDPFEVVAESFLERFRAGHRPSIEEYAARHPELADQIRELLPALVMVEQDLTVDRDPGSADPTFPPTPSPFKEWRLGDYRILREVGRGGMGVVYEAEQVSLGRRVALKVLPGHFAGHGTALERFRREAKAAARLHHTNIVPVFEVGRDGEVAYYAMQFIRGQGLDQIVEELRRLREPGREANGHEPARSGGREGAVTDAGPRRDVPSEPQGRELVRTMGMLLTGRLVAEGSAVSGSGADAESGLAGTERFDPAATSGPRPDAPRLHVGPAPTAPGPSPSAVLPGGKQASEVDTSGHRRPYFRSVAQIGRQTAQGLAYAHARGIVHRDIKPSNLLLDTEGVVWITDFGLAKADDDGMTASGDILGTLRYMSPERFRGEGGAPADIYALGLTLYELLTLRPAYDSTDRLRLIEKIKNQVPVRPRMIDLQIPRDLETIVLKAIDKDPSRRYTTAGAIAEDLRRFLFDEPILARRASTAERCWRWARRNPTTAGLSGLLGGLLVLATVGSLLAAQQFRDQAQTQSGLAAASETQRLAAERAGVEEVAARRKADQVNAGLLATQEELRRTVYATRCNLGLAAWYNDDVGLLRSLIGLLRPSPGETDYRGWEWRYLWRLGHEDRLTLRSQDGARFTDVAYSPDGRTLATLDIRGRVQFWDWPTGRSRRTTGDPGRGADLASGVGALAFSPDGRRLAGPGPDASLVLYAVDTGLAALRLEGTPGAVLKLAWSPDGRTLVAAISAHVMRVWDAADGHLIHEVFGGHGGPVAAVAFSPDGRTIVSASFDRTVKLWNLEDPVRPLAVLKGHTDEVRAVAFSPDGRRVASAGLDQTLRIWDAGSGAELAMIGGHGSGVTSLAYFPDGGRIATGSSDRTVRIWDTSTHREVRTFKNPDTFSALAVSPDGRDIAAAADVTVQVFDAASPPRPLTLRSPSVLTYGGGVECLAFSPDGRRLVSGHDDHALRVWELPSGRPLHVIQGHTDVIKCVAFSPDGRTIASGGREHAVRLWDSETGQPRITFSGHTDEIRALVFTPDGLNVLSGGYDRTIQAWDPATGVVRYVLRGHSETVHDLTLSPDGLTLVSASYDKTCISWDLPGRRPRAILRGHTSPIDTVAFSPDGRTLATASDDRTVRLWDAASGSPRGILEGHIYDVDGLAFSPDGRLASSGWDGSIRIWDPASGQALLVLKGHTGRIRCVKFSPDGRTLASASSDRTIKLWEAAPVAVLAAASRGDGPARRAINISLQQDAVSPRSRGVGGREGEGFLPSRRN